jgi:hypothetical protein
MDAFHNNWLCRYPRPIQVTFDNGSEFKSVFKEMCDQLPPIILKETQKLRGFTKLWAIC